MVELVLYLKVNGHDGMVALVIRRRVLYMRLLDDDIVLRQSADLEF